MGRTGYIILGLTATLGVGIGIWAKSLKKGIQIVFKRPNIDVLKFFSSFKLELPLKLNVEIYNQSGAGVTVDNISVVTEFRSGDGDWSVVGTNRPSAVVPIPAKSFQPLTIPIILDLNIVGLQFLDIVKNKGNNYIRSVVTTRSLGINVSSTYEYKI
jgi:hypothetical protein